MNKITEPIAAAWRAALNWLEHGDLVPLIVLVSAYHYAAILQEHDAVIPAIAIGTLVDLGHYRIVRVAVRYQGNDWREWLGRWAFVVLMTAIALNYQQRFYADWWLSIPLPALILALAWLGQRDERSGGRKVAQCAPLMRVDAPPVTHDAHALRMDAPDNAPEQTHGRKNAAHDANPLPYACKVCGERCASPSAVASHVRWTHRKGVK